MRRLEHKYRLGGLSIPEITRGVKLAALRVEGDITLNGRKLDPGPLVNAITLAFLRMPEAARKEYLREAVKQLEALLATDDGGGRPEGDKPDRADVSVHHVKGKAESGKPVGGKGRG